MPGLSPLLLFSPRGTSIDAKPSVRHGYCHRRMPWNIEEAVPLHDHSDYYAHFYSGIVDGLTYAYTLRFDQNIVI